MAIAACSTPTEAQAPTEALEAPGVLGHGARRESLTFVRPAAGRYLAIEDGGLTRLVALHQPVTHLGRGFSADLRLEDQSVSRRHAVIVDAPEGARILDDRSANGTFVKRPARRRRAPARPRRHRPGPRRTRLSRRRGLNGSVSPPSGGLSPTFGSRRSGNPHCTDFGRQRCCVGVGGWWQVWSSSRWG